MQKKDALYKALMEERHVDKDYLQDRKERNLSHITFLPTRGTKTPKYP